MGLLENIQAQYPSAVSYLQTTQIYYDAKGPYTGTPTTGQIRLTDAEASVLNAGGQFVLPTNSKGEIIGVVAADAFGRPISNASQAQAVYNQAQAMLGAGLAPGLSPPMPHPDASNLALGPNLGGTDAVVMPGDLPAALPTTGTKDGAIGLLLLGGVVLSLLLMRR